MQPDALKASWRASITTDSGGTPITHTRSSSHRGGDIASTLNPVQRRASAGPGVSPRSADDTTNALPYLIMPRRRVSAPVLLSTSSKSAPPPPPPDTEERAPQPPTASDEPSENTGSKKMVRTDAVHAKRRVSTIPEDQISGASAARLGALAPPFPDPTLILSSNADTTVPRHPRQLTTGKHHASAAHTSDHGRRSDRPASFAESVSSEHSSSSYRDVLNEDASFKTILVGDISAPSSCNSHDDTAATDRNNEEADYEAACRCCPYCHLTAPVTACMWERLSHPSPSCAPWLFPCCCCIPRLILVPHTFLIDAAVAATRALILLCCCCCRHHRSVHSEHSTTPTTATTPYSTATTPGHFESAPDSPPIHDPSSLVSTWIHKYLHAGDTSAPPLTPTGSGKQQRVTLPRTPVITITLCHSHQVQQLDSPQKITNLFNGSTSPSRSPIAKTNRVLRDVPATHPAFKVQLASSVSALSSS